MKTFRWLMTISVAFFLSGCEHFYSSNSSSPTTAANSSATPEIALLLPLEGKHATQGRAIRDGFMAAYYQQSSPRVKIALINTNTTANIDAAYQQAVSDGARVIVGPVSKEDVTSVSHWWSSSVPILALNYSTSGGTHAGQFYQLGLSPTGEAKQLAEKARSNGNQRALIITPATSWGERVAESFEGEWQKQGGTIAGEMKYVQGQNLSPAIQKLLGVSDKTLKSKTLSKELHGDQRRQDVDVIFLAASPATARQIRPLLKFYYAGNLPVYATSSVYSGTPSPNADRDLDGIIFCDMPWVLNDHPLKGQLSTLWSKNFHRNSRLYGLGVDAYTLAMQLYQSNQITSRSFNGVTGQLYLNSDNQFEPQLHFAQFRNGVPQAIN